MDSVSALILVGITAVAVAVAAGTALNLRSVRAGDGPSKVGLRIQSFAVGILLLVVSGFGAVGTVQAGLWPLFVLLIPILGVSLAFIVGAVQRR